MNGLRENCPNESMRQAFANGELSDAMALSVANHISQCKVCSEELDQCYLPQGNDNTLFSETGTQDQLEHLVESVTSQEPGGISFSFSEANKTSHQNRSTRQSLYMGRYRILETIGRGSFGVVRVGVHPVLKKKVAVKVSHVAFRSSTRKMQFLREAETAARLDHPNIVRVVDADELPDQRCYIVFQYVEGKNLKELVDQRQLHQGQALSIFRGILAGVEHAHQRGIVHRDLKLSNILVDADMQPRITDFGLALMLNHHLTAEGSGGTRGYMAPEQENGEIGRIDARTDIFALGVLLAKLTTARPLNTINDTVSQSFDAMMEVAGVPADLIRICKKCCMSRPRDRYQTIAELREDLEQIRKHPQGNKLVVPHLTSIGLEPFQAKHATLYREWLSVGRLGNELLKTIKNWKARIHRFGFEPSFSVGMISGDSGSGKSSLVDAGLLTECAQEIQVKKYDCKKDDSQEIEDFLLHYSPDSDSEAGTKTLVVIDHFSIEHFADFELLSRAFRRADGTHLQCLLIVGSVELAGALKLFDELEIAVDPHENMFRMPALDERSAQKLLLEWGQSNDCLQDRRVTSQSFVEQIISTIALEGELSFASLHLFLDRYGERAWDYLMISEMETVDVLRFRFAEKHWFKSSASKLLPVLVSALECDGPICFNRIAEQTGSSRSVREQAKKLLSLKPKLLTPSPNSEPTLGNSYADSTDTYVLAQDYYRPILSDFVKHSHRLGSGFTEGWYKLHQNAERWQATQSNRDLLPFRKAIPTFFASFAWPLGANEKSYLRKSVLQSMLSYSHIAIIALCVLMAWAVRQIQNDQVVYGILRQTKTHNSFVGNQWYYDNAAYQLSGVANDATESPARRTAALGGLVNNTRFPEEAYVDLTVVEDPYQQQLLFQLGQKLDDPSPLINQLRRSDQTSQSTDREAWLTALHLLNLGYNERIESLYRRNDTFGNYLANVRILENSLTLRSLSQFALAPELSNEVRMLIVDSMNEVKINAQKDDPEFAENIRRLVEIARPIQHQRLTSCIVRVLTMMDQNIDTLLPNWNDGPDQVGFVNSVGLPMLKMPNIEEKGQPLFASACEIQFQHVRHFRSASSDLPHSIGEEEHFRQYLHPATSCTPEDAMEYCNYLSLQEGRAPYYTMVEHFIDSIGSVHLKVNRSKYKANPEADGYRLVASENWHSFVDCAPGWNVNTVAKEDVELFANSGYTVRELRKFGKSRSIVSGFYDIFGNSDELHSLNGSADDFVYRGEFFLRTIEDGFSERRRPQNHNRAFFLCFRVCCPPAAQKTF